MKESIIKKARNICENNFMDYPDYDKDIPLSLADALTVIIMDNEPHDTELASDKVYDFIDNIVGDEITLEEIVEAYPEEKLLKAEGYDEAVIGVSDDFNAPIRLVYSVKKCLDILMKDMTYEEALEFFNFNTSGAYFGEKTPVWNWDNH